MSDTIAPAPVQPAPLTPEINSSETLSQTLGPLMVPMVSKNKYKNSFEIANSSYVFFNRCILYLSIIFAVLYIASLSIKSLMVYHNTFKNWAVGLLLLYIFLVIINFDDYNQMSGSQILFF